MTTFTTPGPAALTVRFAAGRLVVSTAATTTSPTATMVDVRPANPDSTADVEHAAATTVEQRGDTIEVIAPTSKGWFGRSPRLDIRAVVPAHSRVDADVKSADVQLAGELGRVAVSTASGDVSIEHAAELQVTHAPVAIVSCRSVAGDATVTTASGDARLDAVVRIGGAVHRLGRRDRRSRRRRRTGADPPPAMSVIGHADGSVTVRTASGDVRVDSVRRGTVEIDSASGDVEIGVAAGTAAWLDVQALSGSVSSSLDPTDAPGDDAETVSIHAHTLSGDVRAPPGALN